MRLAFCFMSNDKEKANEMDYKISFDIHYPYNKVISSVTRHVLFNHPISPKFNLPKWHCEHRNYDTLGPTDFVTMRQDSLDMAKNSDFIFVGDDDMQFLVGSVGTISQCIEYMIEYPDCGVIYLGGGFGEEGLNHGDEIFIANRDWLATNRGMILRNKPVHIDNRLFALGSGADVAMGFTCLMQGYYIARRLHTPILHDTKNRWLNHNRNITYDLQYIQEKGIIAKVNQVIGPWEGFPEWPKAIFSLYRQEAMRNGRIPKYDENGEIQ
jgi:hypothetical protein